MFKATNWFLLIFGPRKENSYVDGVFFYVSSCSARYAQSDLELPLGARFKLFISVLLEMCPKGQVLLFRDARLVEQIVRLARDSTRRTNLPALMKVAKRT